MNSYTISGNADDNQWSPLHIAAKFDLRIFKEILPKFDGINPKNSFGTTPLHCAVINGQLEVCKFIIENVNEDEKNSKDNFGFTPLHYAALLGNLTIYKFIVQNVEEKKPMDELGITPLKCAIRKNRKNICKFIDGKTDIKVPDLDIMSEENMKILMAANIAMIEYSRYIRHFMSVSKSSRNEALTQWSLSVLSNPQ